MAKKKMLTLYFAWNTCSVDPRQFNQQRQLVHPVMGESNEFLHSIRIAIEIPNTDEYVFSHVKATEDTPEVITLTPAGHFYAVSLLEAPFTQAKEASTDDEWGEEDTAEETFKNDDEKSSDDAAWNEEGKKLAEEEAKEWGDENNKDTKTEDDDKEWNLESEEWD